MKLNRTLGAAIVAIAAVPTAFANGTVVAQMEARISDLQVTFTDFRPDDGIDAGIAWQRVGNGRATVTCCSAVGGSADTIELVHSLPFSSTTPFDPTVTGVTQTQGNLAAIHTQGGLQAKAVFDQSFFDSTVIAHGNHQSVYSRAVATIYNGTFSLALNPGTEVSLRGLTSVDGFVDLTQQLTSSSTGQSLNVYLSGETRLSLQDNFSSPDIVFWRVPTGNEAFASKFLQVNKVSGQVGASLVAEVHKQKSFEYLVRNNGSQQRWLTFDSMGQVFFNTQQVNGILTPVPEPEAWAMGLAGLGLMGVFARRRQAA